MPAKHGIQKIDKLAQRINEVWSDPTKRDGRWGDILKAVTLESIRGLSATIEFRWPITVISGPNRSGKTTILQVCSMAYKNTASKRTHYYPYRWFDRYVKDETPATAETLSTVKYKFSNKELNYNTTPIPAGRWTRAKKPSKWVELRTIAQDEPTVEKGRQVHARKKHLKDIIPTDANSVLRPLSEIMGVRYDVANMLKVDAGMGKESLDVLWLTKDGISYTDWHMGAGEQKVFRLVNDLEKLPEQSLILLEEPEVTLHPEVHYRLAYYLMGLCIRKGHQIIMTTHSPAIFRILPQEARILLRRNGGGTEVTQGADPLIAERELSGSVYTNKDIVFVEDEVAKIFLKKILERADRFLFEQAVVVEVGDRKRVFESVEILRSNGIRVVGVRDPDVIGQDPSQHMLSLPGGQPLECLLLESENLKRASTEINRLEDAFTRAESRCVDQKATDLCKCKIDALSTELNRDKRELVELLIRAWLKVPRNLDNAGNLVRKIRETLASE